MSTPISSKQEEGERLDALFDCLASRPRREILAILNQQVSESHSQRDLATRLRSQDEKLPEDQLNDELEETLANIYHFHLPKLESAGLIDWDAEHGRVTLTDHLAFQDEGITDVLHTPEHTNAHSLEALFNALSNARRRTILDILSHQFGPIHTETLARELGATEHDVVESDVPEADVEQILVTLHHVHLPVLADAGVIAFDGDEQTVVYEGHHALRVPWMHSVLEPDFRPSLTGESEPGGIGEIQDREKVISFGQSLCDRAEEELFCMFTGTNMLEAGCFTRIRDAARRGVNVYLGTRDPAVREYIQENVPEVTLWEPQTNWLNLPVAGNKVGRLVFADREAVMLGTLLEKTENGFHKEQAIIGEGTDNTLVVMVAQLLSPHLDRVGEQTADIETRLPF